MEKKQGRPSTTSHCKTRKRKPEKKKAQNFHLQSDFNSTFNTIFGLLISSLHAFHKHPKSNLPLLKKCLYKLRLSFDQDPPIDPIISLLPTLLRSKCSGVASRGAEIVGAAALESLEVNERVALDDETVRALVSALGRSNRRVSMAACNAVLDLCITCVGRQRLLSFCALEVLIFRFFQLLNSSTVSVSLCVVDSGSVNCPNIGLKGDEHPASLLKAATHLINACNIEQLENIPRKLSEAFLVFLTDMWAQVHRTMLSLNTMKCSQEEGPFNISNFKIEALAESVFRLSVSDDRLFVPLPLDMVQRGIFGLSNSGFEDFMLNLWEVSPSIVGRLSGASFERDNIFNAFLQSLNTTETFPSFLSSILQIMVSCLPIASDELDILSFLKEARHKLGCRVIYQQDLRVLRTKGQLKKEEHFFPFVLESHFAEDSHIFNLDDISKCEEAFREGYTVALRGMEFRFSTIAAIADGLASLFGQPSVGANMYLTPPDSQGLARHYDDHCVFVCQLFGTKKWKVFSQSNLQLPRLYNPLPNPLCSEVDSLVSGREQFTLTQGDILYVPRGFLHEAYTEPATASSGYSLHLTFGIEVEPPFEAMILSNSVRAAYYEDGNMDVTDLPVMLSSSGKILVEWVAVIWEGFVHIALCYWNQRQERSKCSAGIVFDVSVALLHIAISLIGNSDPIFRKACLVAATSPPSRSDGWLDLNQRKLFCHLIDQVNAKSKFTEALRNVETATQKNEDLFQRIRWLRNLDLSGRNFERLDWNIPFRGTEELFQLSVRYKCELEAAFMQVKSRFCCEISFDDVKQSYRMLLEKYRKLSIHVTKLMS
ncbi:uncharacterized protein LOC21396255 [Morus notabilis]|uniref:uncharacterized protein LOC21396255 n=1 Tax=Morus notabilis TaxID=981085 RepID=UPI000CECED10|nr:uncharacterized protein LOC21396255 [Morus notabilis]